MCVDAVLDESCTTVIVEIQRYIASVDAVMDRSCAAVIVEIQECVSALCVLRCFMDESCTTVVEIQDMCFYDY